MYDYKNLPLPGCAVQTDDSLAAAWCYDPAQKLMVSYDTPEVVAKKTQFIKQQGLGGGMWWESSSDRVGDMSLISTVRFLLLLPFSLLHWFLGSVFWTNFLDM